MNKESDKALISLARANQAAHVVFLFMVRNMDDKGMLLVSQKAMGNLLSYSVPTIARAVAYLRKHKFIKIAKSGTSSIYHINAHVFTVESAKNHGNSGRFSASVVLCETEMKLSGFYDVK